MGEINLSQCEKDALSAIDPSDLDRRVDQAVDYERVDDLALLPLDACGLFVSTKLREFRRALTDHSQAKAAQKRERTGDEVRRAAYRLKSAFRQMQRRMEEERKEGQLYRVDDHIMHPHAFYGDEVSFRVGYRWRKTIGEEWQYGSIEFTHVVDTRPAFQVPVAKRRPSAAKRQEELHDKRYRAWEHLMRSALHTVRDFFREGGDASSIPSTFKAVADQSGSLNNHSLRFWPTASTDSRERAST